jgi:hypothetical protein
MWKVFRLALVAGSLLLGEGGQQASAEMKCDVKLSTEAFIKGYDVCYDGCKKEKDQKGCNAACDRYHTDCLHQMAVAKREADAAAEKKKDEERQKEARCRAPVIACVSKCNQETHNDQKKCDDRCGKNSDVQKKYRECAKP